MKTRHAAQVLRATLLPAAAVLGATAFAATGSVAPAPLEAAVEGSVETQTPVAGLGAAFHAGRRAALREALDGGWVLLRGLPPARGYVPFRQDKVFWYFTGVESPDAALLMNVDSGAEILYLPPPNPRLEQWDGPQWDTGDDWVSAATGIADVRSGASLLGDLEALAAEAELTVHISRDPFVVLAEAVDRARPFNRARERDPLDGRTNRERALQDALEGRVGAKVENCAAAIAELRRIKQPEEIEALRRAADASVAAMVEAIRSTRPGLFEWELDGLMTFLHRREGGTGPAYYAIVGSGPNSCVLHYNEVSRSMATGDVVLVDYACELDHQTCDITRTWPVAEAFSPRAAELYDVVLEAQLAGIEACVPGASFGDVDAACNAVFERHGLLGLRLHGPSHYIGMEVHDAGSYTKRFEPGVVLTVEPGLYDLEAGIGIRIEDVIVVTDGEPLNLTAAAPRTRAAVEALRGEAGLLEWLDRERAGEE